MSTPSPVFRYTSLPTEIRTIIMEYALVPGDVYPCSKEANPASKPPSRKNRLQSLFKRPAAMISSNNIKVADTDTDRQLATTNKPGFHLLTTSKSAYRDGYHMFYTMNTFHLPPGSVFETEKWLEHIEPEHRALIKRVGIAFSLKDLTPDVMREMDKKWLWDLPAATTRGNEQRVVFEVCYILCWRLWMDKVKWLKGWEGLERVLLCLPDGGVVRFEGEAFRDWEAKDEKGVLEGAREKVRTQLEGMVGEMGWKGVKKALLAKEIA